MKILPIAAADFAMVLSLNEASIPHVNRISAEELGWFVDNATYARCVKSDDRLAAFLIGMGPGTDYQSPNYRWFCDRYDNFAYIDRIAVAPWARRRGIAENLYQRFAEQQPLAPVMTCEVNLRPANEGSMRFHERLGFRQVGTQETNDGEKEVALLEKPL